MSARLPIYRSLTQRVEILGLGLWEIAFLLLLFLATSELLFFIRHKTLVAFVITFASAALLRRMNRKFERNFLARLIRFIYLPARLNRKFRLKERSSNER